ncbi:Ca2+ antiporter-like protein [Coleophoma cylindrospora]|uniref:Vacuolar calcium ion transporter n=1 Tax=Coleophoma cylindrospora TaxID=1849047 RepID=A0A3D8S064_9HELO|nr:Ca2+ antiporter-like protein [Coleophoma cylindrospora]
MGLFERRSEERRQDNISRKDDIEMTTSASASASLADPRSPAAVHPKSKKGHHLPIYNHKGHKVARGIQPDGESGRRGIHPFHFFKIVWASSSDASRLVNILWPVVPAAIAVRYALPDRQLLIFILNYIAMVPCANLIGFAGQELARKMRKVFGVLTETTLGSVVEIILFMVLLSRDKIQVIQAAILGSILATQLLCLGLCFFVGGLTMDEQEFDSAVSEVGGGLLLVAGFGLMIPAVFKVANQGKTNVTTAVINAKVLDMSHITAILLIVAYFTYLWFQARTHHGIYDAIFEKDEERDADRQRDLDKNKLTLTECIIALAVSITLVTYIAIALVEQIDYMVEAHGISDSFIGLILIPLVEKAAEHLTAVDEAYDNQMNFALSHVLGATIQTALFNAPLAVIVGWGLGKEMSFAFEIFDVVVLILAILVVGRFLDDQKSNYLEGALCVIVYMIIAVAAFFYPNPIIDPATGTIVERSMGALAG